MSNQRMIRLGLIGCMLAALGGQTLGYAAEREDFTVAGHRAFVLEPPATAWVDGPMPWVWYAPTLGKRHPSHDEQWMFDRLHAAGIAIAGIDVGESYGSPAGRKVYQAFYKELTNNRGYGAKPVLLARSRGGLMLYSWAVEHPESVGGIAGIYPVCNIASYPGIAKAAPAFGMNAEELERRLAEHNPVDRLEQLAAARVPLFHIQGDSDRVVPHDDNSGLLAARYQALGGPVQVELIAGQGHNMWRGWFESQSLTDFMIARALGSREQRQAAADAGTQSADVIVYGSTPGGVCASIAAAREGASVILLESTDHVGGLSTGGLSHCDSNQMVRDTVMGLFDQWHARVVKDYTDRGLQSPYHPEIKDQSRWTFEPHVAMRVTMQMLREAGVKVLTEHYLNAITKDGPRIMSLETSNGTFTARVFVDGTYEGDLMAAAGVDWTIGREGRAEYGESLGGKQYPKQKMEINGLDDNGRCLPLVTTDDAGPDEEGDEQIMTYSFRLCLTENPDNRVSLPKPDHYDPARFEIVRRALQAGIRVGFDLYPLPGGKLDGNNSIGGQFSLGLVGGGTEWHSANATERKAIWDAHKQYTLEFYHFLTTDPAVPATIRHRYAKLGLCKDEFFSYEHFSPALYVRESRRMKGMYVISQKDILDSPHKDDSIAVSSFPIDSHDCQRIAIPGGGVINEGTIFPVRKAGTKHGYAYQVPYRAILPRPEQCDNLLVPVALSCTHVGISSLRIEGTWMVIGQSAGVAAALAAQEDSSVQTLPYARLRERLLAQKQVLDLP